MKKFINEVTPYALWPILVAFAYVGLIEGYEPAKNIALFAGYFICGATIILFPIMYIYYSNEQFEVSIEKLQNALKKNKLRSTIQMIGIVVFCVICIIKGYFLIPVMITFCVFLVKLSNVFVAKRLEIELAKQQSISQRNS
jgi:hypothetical protein